MVLPVRTVSTDLVLCGWFTHTTCRYVWAPTVIVLCVLIGVAGPHFDTHTPSRGTGAVLHGNRLSYFFLVASGPLSWSSASADYVVYYPASTNRWGTFAATTGGITLGKLLIEFLGIGLGSGLLLNPSWETAFNNDGIGALVVESFRPLNAFGSVCCVVLAVCIAANNIPGTYAAALNWQQLGAPWAKIPRPIWSTFSCIVFTVVAIAGRDSLFDIFINWLSLIGYWTIIWITMTAQDEYIFRKGEYNWDIWNRKDLLPHGFAALFAFVIGWIGAVLCMYQTYFTGPIAALVGNGADLGLPVAMGLTMIVYPPARWLELKYVGR
jgi:purine-cytosine permease-like protein